MKLEEPASSVANHWGVGSLGEWNEYDELRARVVSDQEDVLGAAILVWDEPELWDRLWGQLVDLLVEGLFLDLRREYLEGSIGRDGYVAALSDLAETCRSVGLLPLPTAGA